MIYTFTTWVFFFYVYCFLGWVWETLYVSVKKAHWVNRGFMRGPFLPIYGSGAIVVLIFTLPYRTQAGLVFVAGMVSATILEYITGVAMEKMFHVRYWDYGNQKFNLNGHICLSSSLAWGVFSVILTLYGHTFVEKLVLLLNTNVKEFIVLAITVYFSIDLYESIREAINLREVLVSLESSNEDVRRLQRHFNVAYAFYGSEIKEMSEAGLKKINSAGKTSKAAIMEKIDNARSRKEYRRMNSLLKRNPMAVSKMHEEAFGKFRELISQSSNQLAKKN
jgi:uncharacterized membrane protein